MDRDWINLPRISAEYENEVEEFTKFARHYEGRSDDEVKLKCPFVNYFPTASRTEHVADSTMKERREERCEEDNMEDMIWDVGTEAFAQAHVYETMFVGVETSFFRGEDTRNGFTNHLFPALQRKGVVAFRDDYTIQKGEFLESEFLHAIEGSRVFIVVFSKDYTSSTWCMKELTKIVGWVQQTGRSLLPIFYDVDPSEVRKQSGEFEKVFAEHEQRFKNDIEMIKTWRAALKTSCDRCGWDLKNK
ncbi:TMV resistance protein N-like [Vigna unguiculata]|uniref:TMV resistance protein N-like n=1 Tax=Vigna unguiculata TaxID=3917 RepID=UPI001017219D|nr:TMV resistance protein N-like [Vigna unguiculata]